MVPRGPGDVFLTYGKKKQPPAQMRKDRANKDLPGGKKNMKKYGNWILP